MRILHVLDHSLPIHSGYTFRTLYILRGQELLGWKTFHVTGPKQQSGALLDEVVDGLLFYRTPANGSMPRYPLIKEIELVRSLERRLRYLALQLKPDIIHAHSPALNGLAAIRVGKQLGIPVIYELRAFWEDAAVDHGTAREGGARYRLTRALETYVVRHAGAVTTICEGIRNDLIQRSIPPDRITVIPNAVDTEQFHNGSALDSSLKKSLGLEGKKVLGFIGSFYGYEGLDLLVRALPRILQRRADVTALLVGGGPQETELRRTVETLELQNHVVFTGRVPHDQVVHYYDLVDILVYPRLPMRLTDLVTPLKPLEAMAQGRLIVASDVGGHRELIADQKTGILFTAGSSNALADAVTDLLNHEDRWDGLKAEARRFVETERTWKKSVSRYRKVYETLLATRLAWAHCDDP